MKILFAIALSLTILVIYDRLWRYFYPRQAAVARLYFICRVNADLRRRGMTYDWGRRSMRRET